MKTVITCVILTLFAGWSFSDEVEENHFTYDILPDVTQYGTSDPLIEGYTIIINLNDIELQNGEEKVILIKRVFAWKFHDYQSGNEVRQSLSKLKTLMGAGFSSEIDLISENVRELTAGTKPDTIP